MLLPSVGSLSCCHRCHSPRYTTSSDFPSNIWRSTGSLETHLPTCRLWYTEHLQIPVQKIRKNTPNTTRAQQRHHLSAPAAQSVWTLALTSALRGTCARSSLFPSEGALAASAKGFRLITRSSLSPASEIKGTARQQSKSLVRTRFTCQEGFRTCHGKEQQKDQVC